MSVMPFDEFVLVSNRSSDIKWILAMELAKIVCNVSRTFSQHWSFSKEECIEIAIVAFLLLMVQNL